MIFRRLTSKSKLGPKNLLKLYVAASLAFLLISLTGASLVLATLFTSKEHSRAQLSFEQLEHYIDFHYRSIAEEMWTGNFEAINIRIADIAKQLGNANYELYLADPRGLCVYSASSNRQATQDCKSPDVLSLALSKIQNAGEFRPSLQVDKSSGRYHYLTPLYVGMIHKGYLFASFTDPFEFFRGNVFSLASRFLLPLLTVMLILWFGWLILSRKLILNPYLAEIVELRRHEAIGSLAAQVAHDIRSPLAALEMALTDTSGIEEENRIMARSALNRIRDIANNLLSKKTSKVASVMTNEQMPAEPLSEYLVSSLVEELVTEKRTQYRGQIGIQIEFSIDNTCYGLFARFRSTEIKRVLSNLINNGVEACGERGRVMVNLLGYPGKIILIVSDDGKGIQPHILPLLTRKGQTHGKPGGSGLGLYHAKRTVDASGGNLQITSKLGKGTQITITLPRVNAPDWFVSELRLHANSKVVTLDDDAAIHHIWKQRLESSGIAFIILLPFTSRRELLKWVEGKPEDASKAFFLVDYELLGDNATGLDVIEHLQIASQSALVTSRFEDVELQSRCRKLGVRIIPKSMAAFVPIY